MIKKENGYIALISVILISAILLAVTLETSHSAFFARFNTLATEEKEESLLSAQSCIQVALVRLAENPNYQPSTSGDFISIDQIKCKIVSIQPDSSGNLIVKTNASSGPAVTNLEATITLTNNSISPKSIKEISGN